MLAKVKLLFNKVLRLPIYFLNRINLKTRKVCVGKGVKIHGKIRIINEGSLIIGENTTINSHIKYNPIGFDSETSLYVMNNAVLKIGKNCGISNTAIVSKEKITIEDNVLIGGGCKIYDTDFHSMNYVDRNDSKIDMINALRKPVLIKKSAFIGAGSLILKGVTIGEKSIIGAGSVVTRDIPDGEIWAGNPARFIRGVQQNG